MSSSLSLNLLVLRAERPRELADYYSAFGCEFQLEKHGKGPLHHACDMEGTIFEIYPCQSEGKSTNGTRLGFKVESIDAILNRLGQDADMVVRPQPFGPGRRCVLKDPEGHKIELLEV